MTGRRVPPALAVAVDLLRWARSGGRWSVLLLVLAVTVAVAFAGAGQAAAPWLVYGGL